MNTILENQLKKFTRDEVVPFYASLIRLNAPNEAIVEMNRLILTKWTSSGLEYIKVRAWRSLGFKA